MLDPKLAVDELEYAVRELGFQDPPCSRVTPAGRSVTPASTGSTRSASTARSTTTRCGPSASSSGSRPCSTARCSRTASRAPRTSYVYNHIGGLAASHESLCKSLFLSGVTHRFPTLRFGFLEGGVGWACSLFSDLVGHWQKRNAHDIRNLDPDLLDVDALVALFDQYGDARVRAGLVELHAYFSRPSGRPEQLDEFAAAALRSVEDLRDKFVPNFYFGCEADDRLVAWAFDERINPAGARLRRSSGPTSRTGTCRT